MNPVSFNLPVANTNNSVELASVQNLSSPVRLLLQDRKKIPKKHRKYNPIDWK